MKAFTSNTIRIGSSIYLLIPADEVQAQGIKENEYFSAELHRLVPSKSDPDERQ